MTNDEVNRLAEEMELALRRKKLGRYQALRASVSGHDRLRVDSVVRLLVEQRTKVVTPLGAALTAAMNKERADLQREYVTVQGRADFYEANPR